MAALWSVYASFGLILGAVPPLVVYLSEDLDLTRTAMGSVLGAWQLVYIIFAIPAGVMIDRIGLRKTLTLGAALIALSGILRAVAVNYATLYLAVAVFGLGGPFISIGAPKLISAWFDESELGKAMGIYLTAPSVGRILSLATANAVLMPLYRSNWRLTLGSYAVIAAISGLVWWIIARDMKTPFEAQKKGPAVHPVKGIRAFAALLRMPVMVVVLFMSFGSFFFNHGLDSWLPEILRSGGLNVKQAGFWAMMPVAVGVIATLIIPRLATPKRRNWIMIASLTVAASSAVMLNHSAGALLMTGLLLAGIAGRSVMPILMLTLIDSPKVGPARMGAAGGLFFTAGEVGGVLGPLILGVLSDVAGNFGSGLYALAGSSAFLVLLAVWLVLENRK
ncbi:MAG: MFS transporter [Spirochaetales bacterium]|nr:MFS transporter [Spirochaetales bacterium]